MEKKPVKRVIMLSPDVVKHGMGGLGEHVREICLEMTAMRPDLCIDVVSPFSANDYKINDRVIQRFSGMLPRVKISVEKHYTSVVRTQSELVARCVKLPKPALVHAHDWSVFDAGRLVSMHFGCPLISSLHLSVDDLVGEEHQDFFQPVIDVMFDMQYGGLIQADKITNVSNHYARKFGELFAEKSVTVGNGIERAAYEKNYPPFAFPGSRPKKLLYIGRFAHMKNIDGLLKAKLPPDVDLCFAGCQNGSDAIMYESVITHAKNREEIHFLGPLYEEEKARCLKSAWAGIFPSRKEPFGIVGLEFFMAGTPLIATFRDGMLDYMDDECAIRCDISPESLSSGIEMLSRMPVDAVAAMKAKAKARAMEFTWEKVARRVLGVYEEVWSPDFKRDPALLNHCCTRLPVSP
jgi:glycosyltransferase involved in cell wall biosynthesis